MIIELSKDKSLKTVLLKANIDNETMSLVKSDATITDIKNSLIKNLSPNNIVSYRKYISKAEDEEEEEDSRSDEEIRDDTEEELDETLSTTAAGGGGTGISQTQDLDTTDKETDDYFEETESRRKQMEHKSANRELTNIEKLMKSTETLANNIIVKKSKGTLTGYKFLNFASWVGRRKNIKDSNTVINLMTVLSKEPDFLNKRYKSIMSADGKLEVLVTTKNGKTTKTKAHDVQKTVNTLIALQGKIIPIEDTDDKMSFYDVLVNLHINEFDKNPSVKQNKSRWAKQLRDAKKTAKNLNKPDREIALETKATIKSILTEFDVLLKKEKQLTEYINVLKEFAEGGTEGIIARKIEQLTLKIKNLYEEQTTIRDEPETTVGSDPEISPFDFSVPTAGGGKRVKETKTVPKKDKLGEISELQEFIEQIKEGKVDIIEEATEEIQEDLEEEEQKLLKVKGSIERISQFKKELDDYVELSENFPNPPEVPQGILEGEDKENQIEQMERKKKWDGEVKKLIELGSVIESIHHSLRKMSKLIKKLDDSEVEEFKEWVSGKAGTRPNINEVDKEWLSAIQEGNLLDTYDNRTIVQVENLSHRLVKKYSRVDEIKGALKQYMRN
jgi:hypothetical protein